MKHLVIAIICATAAMGCLQAAFAQATSNTISLSATEMTMTQLASTLSQKSGQLVLADPSLKAVFGGNFSSAKLEDILSTVTKASQLEWYLLWVPAETPVEAIQKQAAGQVALLKQVKAESPIYMYDPASKAQITFTRASVARAQAPAAPQGAALRSVYYITGTASAAPAAATTTAAAKPVEGAPQSYAYRGRQQNDEFLAMTPEQRQQAIEAQLQTDLELGPDKMRELGRARMQAYRDLREKNPAAFNAWRDNMRSVWGGSDRWRRDRGNNNNRNQTPRGN